MLDVSKWISLHLKKFYENIECNPMSAHAENEIKLHHFLPFWSFLHFTFLHKSKSYENNFFSIHTNNIFFYFLVSSYNLLQFYYFDPLFLLNKYLIIYNSVNCSRSCCVFMKIQKQIPSSWLAMVVIAAATGQLVLFFNHIFSSAHRKNYCQTFFGVKKSFESLVQRAMMQWRTSRAGTINNRSCNLKS